MVMLDLVQPFLSTLTTIANYVTQKNTQPQHALNLRTQGQNVPSAEEGTKTNNCGLKFSFWFGLGHSEERCWKKFAKGLPTTTNFL